MLNSAWLERSCCRRGTSTEVNQVRDWRSPGSSLHSSDTSEKGKGKARQLDLERALTARDRVGVQDMVLLDAHNSETAFLDNLKKRFSEDLIYTYIGTLLISVNPYKELDIYSKKHMDLYMVVNFYELPPHIYALADNAYQTMLAEANNHFILISGESGAGKTEATKKILQYYAVNCPSSSLLNSVRDQMLMSNPILEAFGNAKTLKNDNSSRFGKYMDIQFDCQGDAVGGHILSYLLEKSRVVHQNHGERNFHIFYQLLEGGDDNLLRQLGLERDTRHYSYLLQGECAKVSTINDRNDWKSVKNALSVMHFDLSDIQHLFGIIASVLHLGNVQFDRDTRGNAVLNSNAELRWVSKLTGVHVQVLTEALTYRKIEARADEVLCPFTVDHAVYARDALAKAIYGRAFTWLVNRINESLENQDSSRKTVIGLLDIYGFEVFSVNSFEQFCINYCNEKLQQLFIQLTLKAEQEEYEAEGIEWEPVQFFNNKIICDMVEEKHRGIISVLDEECLMPGDATDLTFLEKMEKKMGNHPHFITQKLADKKTSRTLERGDFRLLHYAGEVTYCVVGFIDKNNDLLYRHIKEVMRQSKNSIMQQCFSFDEVDSRRRPETVATQFKNSLQGLAEILMAKEAWYVRCLKSNDNKQSGRFDDVLVRHQVKYLGLMEHLRVRRAGFAYRRRYEEFLKRYKPLCPDTWPHWRGVPSEGVERLVQHLGYQPDEYKMGRTKIFIRYARTLFATEDAYELCKHELVAKIQAKYKGYRTRGEFIKQKEAATKIETCWRGVQARKERERRAWAVKIIKKFIKAYLTRGEAKPTDNSEYLAFVRQSYLNRLKNNLPKTVLDKSTWLTPPSVMREASEILRRLHTRLLVRKYVRGVTPQRKAQLQLKGVTSGIFKGKKESYPQSVAVPFVDTRISEQDINERVLQIVKPERIKYSVPVVKYDRNGFKPRPRQLILTQVALHVAEDVKVKQRVEYVSLKGVSVSNLGDTFMILHVVCDGPKQKGDLILQCDHLYEVLTKLSVLAKKQNAINVLQASIKFEVNGGKENFVDFSTGQEATAYKEKNGHLMVVTPRLRSR
ncbi:unconventional myosin-Ih isoform X1 [Silurus meridionalis]|uniref:unconventional myosin-Ih isoform X1 n=1 Tax=Silurus meridionalis TaxID=175797 RepID=UPI001EEAB0E1|nr:unconventional myosin-Ih isoform X1 [Silurus meridionalis]XP_046697347.1 unconventional myosin-Ih isoform X1 [Silurus meridionalis]